MQFLMDKLDSGTEYILLYLNQRHKTEKQKFNSIKQKRRHYNQKLKKLAKVVGIESNLISYVARHSVSNILLQTGASLREVQSVYNHQRSDTTRHYLKGMGYSEIEEVHSKLRI